MSQARFEVQVVTARQRGVKTIKASDHVDAAQRAVALVTGGCTSAVVLRWDGPTWTIAGTARRFTSHLHGSSIVLYDDTRSDQQADDDAQPRTRIVRPQTDPAHDVRGRRSGMRVWPAAIRLNAVRNPA
jgi:hypothetical protein